MATEACGASCACCRAGCWREEVEHEVPTGAQPGDDAGSQGACVVNEGGHASLLARANSARSPQSMKGKHIAADYDCQGFDTTSGAAD